MKTIDELIIGRSRYTIEGSYTRRNLGLQVHYLKLKGMTNKAPRRLVCGANHLVRLADDPNEVVMGYRIERVEGYYKDPGTNSTLVIFEMRDGTFAVADDQANSVVSK